MEHEVMVRNDFVTEDEACETNYKYPSSLSFRYAKDCPEDHWDDLKDPHPKDEPEKDEANSLAQAGTDALRAGVDCVIRLLECCQLHRLHLNHQLLFSDG